MLAHFAALALAASAFAADAKVTPLAGEPLLGRLVSLTGEQVVVSSRGSDKTLTAADLMSVEFAPPEKPLEKTAVWIDLLDGSKLQAERYTARDGKSSVQLVGGPAVQIPTQSIAAVCFRQ